MSSEPNTDADQQPPPKGGDSAAAAAALSSLDARSTAAAEEAEESTRPHASAADKKALGEAMSRLEIAVADASASAEGKDVGVGMGGGDGGKDEAAAKIRIEPVDVALLVQELEVSKLRAGEMLRAGKGDVVAVLRDWVRGAY